MPERRFQQNYLQPAIQVGFFSQPMLTLSVSLCNFVNFWKHFGKMFGTLQKRCKAGFDEGFYDFLKFSENLRKCLESIEKFADVIGAVLETFAEVEKYDSKTVWAQIMAGK